MFIFFYLVLCSDRIAIRQRGEAREEKILCSALVMPSLGLAIRMCIVPRPNGGRSALCMSFCASLCALVDGVLPYRDCQV